MPLYTYRRADGTMFDLRQGFNDEPLTVDPETGQSVVRVIQPAPIIFKGSGFYVNDSKGKTNSTLSNAKKADSSEKTDAAVKPASEAPAAAEAPKAAPSTAAAD